MSARVRFDNFYNTNTMTMISMISVAVHGNANMTTQLPYGSYEKPKQQGACRSEVRSVRS